MSDDLTCHPCYGYPGDVPPHSVEAQVEANTKDRYVFYDGLKEYVHAFIVEKGKLGYRLNTYLPTVDSNGDTIIFVVMEWV